MIIANNATSRSFLSNYNTQNSKLQTSMSRLSSGRRMIEPGEAPADLGISERFRSQVRNSEAAGFVIQNAINMFQSTDQWLQEVHNILGRMSELAVASSDGSKSQTDRGNLDLEFQQLKTEVGRIAEAGKYNGLQVNGKTAVAVYDSLDHQIRYMQNDGTDERTLPISLRDGNSSDNGINYAFESSAANGSVGDFLFSSDGKSLLYVAQKSGGALSARKSLMKLDIASNTIETVQLTSAGGASATTQARLVLDEKGRVWVSDPSTAAASASKNFNVKLLNQETMALDAGGSSIANAWAGGVSLASSFSEFAVHDDYLYFVERSGAGPLRFVRRNLFDTTAKEILVNDLSSASFDLDAGETYAVSADGQYLAFENEDGAAGDMTIINTSTGKKGTLSVGTRTTSIASLDFDANNNLYWTDTGTTADENAIKKARVVTRDDGSPALTDITIVSQGNAGHVGAYNSAQAANNMGLSVGGGSPANAYTFQIGADADMAIEFEGADVRLTHLGISRLEVGTNEGATIAISKLAKAVDTVASQRAMMGSQVSRMNFIYAANQGYANNIAAAESRLRDVDIALETSRMTQAQILAQTGISVLAQANAAQQNVLRLLQ
jgi:flagellin